jgi:hypothetical protein
MGKQVHQASLCGMSQAGVGGGQDDSWDYWRGGYKRFARDSGLIISVAAFRVFGPVIKDSCWLPDRDRPLADLCHNIASARTLEVLNGQEGQQNRT